MIKINLIPYVEKKKEADLKRQIIVISSVFVVFLLIIASLHIYFIRSISKLEKEVTQAETQLKNLTKIVGDLEKFKMEKTKLNKKLAVIESLDKNRLAPVLFLDDLTTIIPSKHVWLTALSESGDKLRVEGIASDNSAVSNFMNNLKKSRHIKSESVELIFSRHAVISGIKLKKFTLSCVMNKG